jgi:glycosyltransferase involved in cell wall biosynthesis
LLRISIITPSFNQGIYLEETISSVLEQRYPNLEYLVIDGGSTDETLTILPKYDKLLYYWISEQDRGQSHAINKGLSHATGDILGYLNSDDLLLPGSLRFVANWFEHHPEHTWLSGSVLAFQDDPLPPSLLHSKYPSNLSEYLLSPWHIWQQGTFWRKTMFETVGYFNEHLHYAMDMDYWARAWLAGFRPVIVKFPLAAMRMHPESKSCRQAEKFNRDIRFVLKACVPKLSSKDKRELRRLRLKRLARLVQNRAIQDATNSNKSRAWKEFLRALSIDPMSAFERSTWGSMRRLLRQGGAGV